ncbi:cell division initiation protein [Deinococcus metalli]|uniref:Cell division initiation protein n=1 Tax=Deinococcus metalli TaxID=1141878 RepID=A0A7W8KBH2_9DEIO|nr:DivIVA domain-containing protein [Deinococcus metalli]MBB5374865.1 cell division initiation protein [Deinococcus metalli]GHF33121.1 minicell-associated protein DivIVA [Deinococcus metalli]
MKSTPLDIRHQEFPQRFNGYDRHSVRAFLSDLAEEFEMLLQRQQEQQDYLLDLEKQLEERKQHEDEIRRAVVSAERIAHELRENAARESDLLLAQATTQREGVLRDAQSRGAELEARHQARAAALEAAFRTRFAELERRLHDLTLERDRVQAQRLMDLEREFTERHGELTTRLSTARTEYAHFLSAYRSLMSSFAEMSAQHVLPAEAALNAPRLPSHDLMPPLAAPEADALAVRGSQEAGAATSPDESSRVLDAAQPDLPAGEPHSDGTLTGQEERQGA